MAEPRKTSRRFSAGRLARNLVIARQVLGITQQQLAAKAEVSRATIAQVESGVSDPRLSTIGDLAAALGIATIVLLLGEAECRALLELTRQHSGQRAAVEPRDEQRMRLLLASGSIRDLHRAAQHGADLARTAGEDAPAAATLAAIFSTIAPGEGTELGAALGRLLHKEVN
jgi:transcriptional regulator with XRE-family HTH domain